MKVAHLSTYDRRGGAAVAAARLHGGLLREGVDSHLLVQSKETDDANTIGPATRWERLEAVLRPYIASLPARRYPRRRQSLFSAATLPDRLLRRLRAISPDIVHLHWAGHGFLRLETLARIPHPVVWTLHDSWAFTGGCHVPFDCVRYRDSCGACPALGSVRERDLSRRVWERKRRTYRDLRLTVVAPSRWIASAARASSLLREARIDVIPNGLDVERFKPVDRAKAREWLGLPVERSVVLFGGFDVAADPNKGAPLMERAVRRLAELGWADRALYAIFGASKPAAPVSLGLETRYFGSLSDEISLALLYAAADVFVAPSLQENQPNTILEAMACGTPCVAFDTSGVTELVEHERTGYLAEPFESEGLARGIAWVLEDEARRRRLGGEARRRAERDHDLKKVARRYAALYERLVGGK